MQVYRYVFEELEQGRTRKSCFQRKMSVFWKKVWRKGEKRKKREEMESERIRRERGGRKK